MRTHAGNRPLVDRSSRPVRSPSRTPTRTERRIIKVRVLRRWGPARIAYLLGLNPSTVHAVLRRYGMARLAHLDRATGRSIRRYEHAAPGDLIHVDIKKLGNIPDGGGHRVTGSQAGQRHRTRTPGKTLDGNGNSHVGYSYLHNAVDDHSRLAYSEILPDEKKETAAAFWQRAQTFFTTHGITVERVLTDNGACYKSHLWRDTLTTAGIARNLGIELYALHDSATGRWLEILELPVIWTTLTPVVLPTFTHEALAGDTIYGDDRNGFFAYLSDDGGKTRVRLLGRFAKEWNAGRLPRDGGEVGSRKPMHVYVKDSEGHPRWRPVSNFLVTYRVE